MGVLLFVTVACSPSAVELSTATAEPTQELLTPAPLSTKAPAPFALDSIRPGQEMAYAFQSTSGEVMHYWLYIPVSYDEGRSWPLIISLHATLGFEPSLENVRQQSPTAFVGSEVDFPFIVISPRAPDGPWDIYHEPMEELIGLLGKSLSIDSKAHFLTGFSTGVVGAWQWALSFPDRFTGLALIAGPLSSPLSEFDPEAACTLRDLPIWVGHSEADERVPIEPIREAVMVLEDCGNTQVTFTVYTELDHVESFETAFGGPELYDWMLALAK
jgi:predicted peptidase